MTISVTSLIQAGNAGGRYASTARRAEAALLFVHQGQRRPAQGRQKHRAFQQAVSRIESTAGFRRSLQRLLELDRRFKRTLSPAQRPAWLELEEALLEHASQLYRSYFESGVEVGISSRSGDNDESGPTGKLRRGDIEVAEALARVLARLARRSGG